MNPTDRSAPLTDTNPVSRRHFIKQSGAAALAFSIVQPHQVRGSQANSKIEVGIVGLGGRGAMIADMTQAHTGYHIKTLADYFPEVVGPVAEKLGVPKERAFSGLKGYQKVIASGVDAVFLETPPYCFPEHVAAAVATGCHVFMAKPVACDIPGCQSIEQSAAKAQANKKVFMVDFQTRTDPLITEAIRRIQTGDYGKPALLCTVYTDDSYADPAFTATIESRLQHLIWVNDDALGGGNLVNAGIHAIDMALWLAQATPLSATGCSRLCREKPHGDSHDVYSLTYEFANGLILNHRGEHLRNSFGFTCNLDAWCQLGHMTASYEGPVKALGIRAGYRGGQVAGLYQRGPETNLAQFHKNITEGLCDNPTVKPSLDATRATILGRLAGKTGGRVTWDQMIKDNQPLPADLTGLKE